MENWSKLEKARNLKIAEDNGIVTVQFNTKVSLGPSSSGKSEIVSSTRGNVDLAMLIPESEIASGIHLGVNCYKKI